MKQVLVTGAGSGIGRCLVERLAAAGHTAWAGARQAADLDTLAQLGNNVRPLQIDVRDAQQVDAAAERIAAATGGLLYGLVNNAGVGGLGWLHSFTDEQFNAILDTNVMGPQRTSRAMLPLLLRSAGRIVHVGSMGGSITSRWYGPYTASKHALEAFAACQRLELSPHGIGVSIVQPGGVDTGIGAKGLDAMRQRFAAAQSPFDGESRSVLSQVDQAPRPFDASLPESADNRRMSAPAVVAQAIEHALFDPRPQARYLVGSRWEGDRVINSLVERLIDANQSPAQQRSRDELVALIDAALAARSRPPC